MKLNEDGKTVAAMDCLVPGIGEIIGGSQREDKLCHGVGKQGKGGYAEKQQYGFFYHSILLFHT